MMMAALIGGLACIAVDGDTLRCGHERVRLLGIDAPELAGHCRRERHCAPGDAQQSIQSLRLAVNGRRVYLRRFGQDRYGRTLALARTSKGDLSCFQLRTGHAIYVARYDNRRALAAQCNLI